MPENPFFLEFWKFSRGLSKKSWLERYRQPLLYACLQVSETKSKKNRWTEWKIFRGNFKNKKEKKREENEFYNSIQDKFLLPFTGCRKVLRKMPDRRVKVSDDDQYFYLYADLVTYDYYCTDWPAKIIFPTVVQQKISYLHPREYHAFHFITNHPNFWFQILTWHLLDSPTTYY